ncbi:MAG: MBOAT family O-acyltransferase, partial [Anaerolineales bacterium]
DFWLPTLSIGLTLFAWAVTTTKDQASQRRNLMVVLAVSLLVLAIGATRFLPSAYYFTPSRPPQLGLLVAACLLIAAIPLGAYKFLHHTSKLAGAVIVLILLLFIVLKLPQAGTSASKALRTMSGQDPSLASALDSAWLGFSYLAFRLIHTLRDFQTGRLPEYKADEYVTYALFYPALTAGPIDRAQRFINADLRLPERVKTPRRLLGIQRILIGTFKKFVIADSLALIALNPQLAPQVSSSLWLWILLYAYSLRIYFDFSGYTDIAIGIGMLVGIQLPENFDRPYLKTNLTAFWNSWHITLAQWFRSYVFNPLTRGMRSSRRHFPSWSIILAGQLLTMLLIGLWHGITWSFAIWGLWHGIGLFVHNRWSAWARPRLPATDHGHLTGRALSLGGWLLTFNYVTLGWLWFLLPDVNQALTAFRTLLGL